MDVLMDELAPTVKFPACRVHPPAADGSEGGGAAPQEKLMEPTVEVKPNSIAVPSSVCEDRVSGADWWMVATASPALGFELISHAVSNTARRPTTWS